MPRALHGTREMEGRRQRQVVAHFRERWGSLAEHLFQTTL